MSYRRWGQERCTGTVRRQPGRFALRGPAGRDTNLHGMHGELLLTTPI